jgi:mannose-6-phosphate isomerase-like protein (cupin superfamily)
MKPAVRPGASSPEYYFEEGCFITELSNSPADPGLSIARARVEPGKTTRWHRLEDIAERYVITGGEGLAEIGDLPPAPVAPGDVVLIPPGTRQRIRNTGGCDLVFLALCTPRFVASAYRDLESTRDD